VKEKLKIINLIPVTENSPKIQSIIYAKSANSKTVNPYVTTAKWRFYPNFRHHIGETLDNGLAFIKVKPF
jgi:hypothetical protein